MSRTEWANEGDQPRLPRNTYDMNWSANGKRIDRNVTSGQRDRNPGFDRFVNERLQAFD